VEAVFKALADRTRRELLDQLFRRDGQTLTELESRLEMTRFGVMKHLRILEDAGLVTARREGRKKLHYLNPVPIRLIHDRWISKYAEPLVGAMGELKFRLEGDAMSELKHIYEVYIRTTADQLWDAITNPALTQQYYYGFAVKSDWKPGSPLTFPRPDGGNVIEGEIIEIDPPKRLVHTFAFPYDDYVNDNPSRVTWEIEPMGDVCKLTLVHDGFDSETATYNSVRTGWNPILSGLKTLLETGDPLVISNQAEATA
jgi:DNA-binding transcriptional ArsR family regulator